LLVGVLASIAPADGSIKSMTGSPDGRCNRRGRNQQMVRAKVDGPPLAARC
jgi:hypothetical protein